MGTGLSANLPGKLYCCSSLFKVFHKAILQFPINFPPDLYPQLWPGFETSLVLSSATTGAITLLFQPQAMG